MMADGAQEIAEALVRAAGRFEQLLPEALLEVGSLLGSGTPAEPRDLVYAAANALWRVTADFGDLDGGSFDALARATIAADLLALSRHPRAVHLTALLERFRSRLDEAASLLEAQSPPTDLVTYGAPPHRSGRNVSLKLVGEVRKNGGPNWVFGQREASGTSPLKRGWRLARKQALAVVGAVVLTDLATAALTLHSRPLYQAHTLMDTGISSGSSVSGTPVDWYRAGALMGNIQEILRSRSVLDRTIASLHLHTTPSKLDKRLSIVRVDQTDLIKITATASSATESADLANTQVASFLSVWQSIQGSDAQTANDFVERELVRTGLRLAEAENRLKAFRTSRLPGTQATLAARLSDLDSQQAELVRDLAAARAGLAVARRDLASVAGDPSLASRARSDPQVTAALQKVRRLEANLQDARAMHDPAASSLEVEVQAARKALKFSVGQAAFADPASADAQARTIGLSVRIAEDSAKLTAIGTERTALQDAARQAGSDAVSYQEIEREVAMREADYKSLADRASQTRLAAAGAHTTMIRIVDPATPPARPASRKLPLKLALATVVALAGSAGYLHLRYLQRKETE